MQHNPLNFFRDLKSARLPLRVVLVKTDPHDEDCVVGVTTLDWRTLAVQSESGSESHSVGIELGGVGASCGVPAGVLHLSADVLPESAFPAHKVSKYLSTARDHEVERQRQFLQYAKHWWKEVIFFKLRACQFLLPYYLVPRNTRFPLQQTRQDLRSR